MKAKKAVVRVTLVALLCSDFVFGMAPAFGQTPGTGNGQMSTPSLTGAADGAFGKVPPGPGPTAPYQPAPQRQFASTPANLCQPAGSPRSTQVASVPRTREAVPSAPGGAPAVTQVTVNQGASQAAQSPAGDVRTEADELSRIEAVFNLDPIRQMSVPMWTQQQAGLPLQPNAQQAGLQQQSLQQQPGGPQQLPGQSATTLGPLGTPLRQYGYAMFVSNVSTFAPVDDIPVGPDYVLGPGDDLTINVWGAVDSTLVRTVDRNGRILLPKVGDLRVWGLSFTQADRLIRDQLARYFRGFQTSVTMGRLRTVNVHVVGEVCQPGVYTLSALSTVTNALFGAGGPSKLGSLRDVRLIRGGSQVAKLDLYDFLQRGDRTRDFRLESGDTIFVPTIGDVVAVAGEVKRPAIYEIRAATRLSDLVELAGGVTPSSYLKRVQIVRSLPSAERVTIDVDLTGFYLKGDEKSNPPVNGGDLVLIHRSDPRVYNTVKVEGAVKYPGAYELKPMMRISQLLPAEKLLPEAQPERVEVARRRADLALEILPVNLKKAWSGDADQDLLLKPLDEVTVRTELRAPRTVGVTGQIVRPGAYTVAEGERLSSLLERAGGFTERAYLKSAIFTRVALRKIEQEQLDSYVKIQEQRILATASTVTIGAEKDEVAAQQQALQARREMLKALAAKVTVGRMVVRLDAPAKLKGSPDDVVLADGDTLEVPEPSQSVFVIGAVRNSTSVQYKEGANVDYYINRVGGYAREADQKDVHIVKADGSAVSSFTNIREVEPGDSVIVPPKQEEKTRWLPTIRDVVTTVGSALLSLAALVALGLL
jgi:protein involved in polysaccharide export with SLBB domain